MKVVFTTNIDAYSYKSCFPENFQAVPRKGELIEVKTSFISYYREKKLPARLEVVRVTWSETKDKETLVVCELWYNETDKKTADLAGATTL